jgi:hypothetical protein
MSAPGFNPIQWNCMVSGCFNYHRHFDIEHFAQCLPSKIGLTDLDGFVELNGHFLITEFKQGASDLRGGADLTQGQRRAFEAFTAACEKLTVIVARCNYITSEIFEVCVIRGGKTGPWKPTTLEKFTSDLSAWARRVAPERRLA